MNDERSDEADHSDVDTSTKVSQDSELPVIADLLQHNQLNARIIADLVLQEVEAERKTNAAKKPRRQRKSKHTNDVSALSAETQTVVWRFLRDVLEYYYADREYSFDFIDMPLRFQLVETFDQLCGISPIFTGLGMYGVHCIFTQNILHFLRRSQKFWDVIPNILGKQAIELSVCSSALLESASHIDGLLDFLEVPAASECRPFSTGVGGISPPDEIEHLV
ncbi:hypothetical protein XU18_4436 [Perkinsela sp. CCAP 1560/4]|nr:hypothetical protein XU18_4436 [Perkinsela sp. CCAP 1560/4]|eukprot:KNH04226.1 hypothetical protein XU18_4436 [Perkinsela sp. CCAP 1560/4]